MGEALESAKASSSPISFHCQPLNYWQNSLIYHMPFLTDESTSSDNVDSSSAKTENMSTLSLICLNLPAQKAESARERKTSASLIHVQETGREDGHHQSWCSEKTQLRKKKGLKKKKKKG